MSIRRHTLINLSGAIIPMFVTLVTVPLYLKTLGDVRYGVLALVWLILGYFSFMDMGLGKATSNYIAKLHNASDKERAEIFWTAIVVNSTSGIFAALILWIIGSYLLTSILKIPSEFQEEAVSALPWMIATLPLALVTSVLNGALEGRRRFFVVNGLQIVGMVAFQVIPLLVAILFSPTLSIVIPAAVLSRVFMNIPLLVACFYCVPLSTRPSFSKPTAKSLLRYGGWVAFSGMLGPFIETIDRFLIGIVLGAKAVTFYSVPYQLVSKARVVPGSLSRALFPRFSADEPEIADDLARASLQTLLVVMTPLIVLGMVLIKPFMVVWVGSEFATIAAPLGQILLIGVWANSLAQVPCFLLMGKGKPSSVAKLHAVEIGPFLLLLWVAIHYLGIYGAAIAWSLRAVVDAVLLLHISRMFKQCVRICILPVVMIGGSCAAVNFIVDQSWVWYLVVLTVFSVFFWRWIRCQVESGVTIIDLKKALS